MNVGAVSAFADYNPIGIVPPADQLRAYYKRYGIREANTDAPVMNQSRLNHEEIVTGVGVGVGSGLGNGKGTEEPKSSCSPGANEVNAATSQVSPDAMELAVLLRQRILENNRKAKISEKQVCAWGREADFMLRLDHRTPEEVTALIQWSQRHPFWKTNILSMGKLREKFDQLALKRNADKDASEPPWRGRERADEEKEREGCRLISKLANGGSV